MYRVGIMLSGDLAHACNVLFVHHSRIIFMCADTICIPIRCNIPRHEKIMYWIDNNAEKSAGSDQYAM